MTARKEGKGCLAFLMRLIHPRWNREKYASRLAPKRWQPDEIAELKVWIHNNLPEHHVRIYASLIKEARDSLSTPRSLGSVSGKIYEIRAKNRKEEVPDEAE